MMEAPAQLLSELIHDVVEPVDLKVSHSEPVLNEGLVVSRGQQLVSCLNLKMYIYGRYYCIYKEQVHITLFPKRVVSCQQGLNIVIQYYGTLILLYKEQVQYIQYYGTFMVGIISDKFMMFHSKPVPSEWLVVIRGYLVLWYNYSIQIAVSWSTQLGKKS